MAIQSKQDFVDFCLRQIGAGVVNIEISDDQVNDCYDHALAYYQEYHYDGLVHDYLVHVITNDDVTNKYVTLTDDIIGVTQVVPIGALYNTALYAFNPQYQIMMNEIHNITSSGGVQYFFSVMQYLGHLEFVLKKEKTFRFNRRENRLHIDSPWTGELASGSYVALEVYRTLDPETYTQVLNDRWLKEYMSAQLKKVWGANTKKYAGMVLPGGIQYNGQQIYNEALQEIDKLEQEAKDNSATLLFMVG